MPKHKILITGSAGIIGKKLCSAFQGRYNLTLLDRVNHCSDNFFCVDLRTFDVKWANHFNDINTVIHLAANSMPTASWTQLIPDNIDALLNVCEACVKADVDRLIFASSCHTMLGQFKKNFKKITVDMEPMPENEYGVSKMIGERICKSYSQKHSFSTICLRIGWVSKYDKKSNLSTNRWLRSLWLSTPDLVQIFEKSIKAKDIDFAVLFAISDNTGMPWDLKDTIKKIYFKPSQGL